MSETPSDNASDERPEEQISTSGTGNKDLTGQAREQVEQAEEGVTGPTPGGG